MNPKNLCHRCDRPMRCDRPGDEEFNVCVDCADIEAFHRALDGEFGEAERRETRFTNLGFFA